MAQLKRIRLHRAHLLNPPDHKPTRGEFGLPENTLIPTDHLKAVQAAVQKQVVGSRIPSSGAPSVAPCSPGGYEREMALPPHDPVPAALKWSEVVAVHRSWRGISVVEGKVISLLCNQNKEGGYSDRVRGDQIEYRVTARTLPEDVRALVRGAAEGLSVRVFEKLATNRWRDLNAWKLVEVRDEGGGALAFLLHPDPDA